MTPDRPAPDEVLADPAATPDALRAALADALAALGETQDLLDDLRSAADDAMHTAAIATVTAAEVVDRLPSSDTVAKDLDWGAKHTEDPEAARVMKDGASELGDAHNAREHADTVLSALTDVTRGLLRAGLPNAIGAWREGPVLSQLDWLGVLDNDTATQLTDVDVRRLADAAWRHSRTYIHCVRPFLERGGTGRPAQNRQLAAAMIRADAVQALSTLEARDGQIARWLEPEDLAPLLALKTAEHRQRAVLLAALVASRPPVQPVGPAADSPQPAAPAADVPAALRR